MTEVESDAMTPQAVAEYAVWYARKVKGPASDVARWLLEEFPWLREPLEVAVTPVADTAGIDAADRPFVVRQFEGTPWVPLHEAARLHDAVQEAGLTIAGLRNDHALRGAAEGVSKLTHGAGQWFGSNDWRPCSCFAHEALAAALRTPKPEGER